MNDAELGKAVRELVLKALMERDSPRSGHSRPGNGDPEIRTSPRWTMRTKGRIPAWVFKETGCSSKAELRDAFGNDAAFEKGAKLPERI